MSTQPAHTVLILGANGRLGRAAATAFALAGWTVLAQSRRPMSNVPDLPAGVQHIDIDMRRTSQLAAGATVVVYAVNPIYTEWDEKLLPLARQGMDIAHQLGALFMLPGNVYSFGENMPALLKESTPHHPTTIKGRQRSQLEREMQMRSRDGLRSVVIRAGDFFGAGTGNWFDQAIVKSLASGELVYPGPLDVPHAWAYLPDLAQAFVGIAEVAGSARGTAALSAGTFTQFHFDGHTLTGEQLLQAIEYAAHELDIAPARGLRRSTLPWWLIRLVGVINPMWRELAKMSYLWRVPHALDGQLLREVLPELPHTPLNAAVRAALLALGHVKREASASPLSDRHVSELTR